MKEKITFAGNSINALVKVTDGKFDYSKISRTSTLATQSNLVTNLKLIKGLHEIYCIHSKIWKDDTLEEAFLEKDEE